MAAGLGLEVVGIDMAAAAIASAQRKAVERGLSVRFIEANALELESLDEKFDVVLDCGLFHVFEDDDRDRFVKSLRAAIPTGGHYYMLCFSDRQPGDWGPRRIAQLEITNSFSHGWRIDSIEAAKIDVNISPDGVLAWRAAITRI
jgi:cyclopropane fatty-acyl-phospholipid synthase-like methyltransferase